ncbi:hypothetical protein SASPL_108660 [Salvia splendens]|uniref:Uncharacterized protein n=1 Tax=Salvia splendens TaxID=180675 RepID=A0A8X8YCP5_SALSN|nr:uncharacterized protein LOC121793987 [Salvia splendens]KAG6430590.1 hypothetical protein SASPL_108660 [Salvia splendens]
MDIPPQEFFFFFTGKWSTELDDVLLASAVRKKENLLVEGPGVPESVISMAGVKIHADFGVMITQSEMERVQLLETCFRMLKAVVATPGVAWVPKTKDVNTEDRVWIQIFETNLFATTNYHQDEPEFNRLPILFVPTDVKIKASEGLKEVIQKEIVILSDTTDNRRNVINISDNDSTFSEEVNSPANLVCEKVRRKLFDG